MTNVVQLSKSPPKRARKTMEDGFILLYRGMKNQPWYKNSEYKAVFLHLLIEASYKPVSVKFHGCDINLLQGQLATSYEQLGRDLGLNKSLIQRALKKFKDLGQISTLKFKNYTVITISNWTNFQQKSDTAIDTAIDTLKPHIKQGVEPRCDTASDTASDTQNNNTISKDIVKRSCTEQGSIPPKPLTEILLPLNKKETFHQVTQEDFDEYVELFPAVDVLQQFRQMYSWLKANPKRRKTKTGIKAFISNWLSKEQNKGGQHASINNGGKGFNGQLRSNSPIEKAKKFIEQQNAMRANIPGNHHPMDET